ncbi:hypothetical protein [Helicobacter macacae]|uniref:hypothetical protein n=1 Tax=Helicobacter macacae TaxID=398626 RepID=UPI00041E257D|nr:hypothetical protein [Helicobacter macacae]
MKRYGNVDSIASRHNVIPYSIVGGNSTYSPSLSTRGLGVGRYHLCFLSKVSNC